MQDENPQPQADQNELKVEDIDSAPGHLPLGASTSPEDIHTLYNRISESGLENFQLKQTIGDLEQKLKTKAILDGLIVPYADRAFYFMCAYSGFVGVCLLLDAFSVWGFEMPEQVQAYLVGSTAATVIGLVGMIARPVRDRSHFVSAP